MLSFLVHKPWFTGRVTGSALVRKVHKDHFTLLLDESDTAFQTRSDYGEVLRGILNTGFERDGTYSMCVPKGNDWEPRDFKTFSPKAIAGIGQLPATVRDRSIPIRMKRARRDDRRQRFRKAKVKPEADELRHRVEEWARVSLDRLREAQPELPDELNDRQQDVCEPLLAVADLAGVCWPARARAALVELCAGLEMPDDAMGLRLLADTRDIFTQQQSDRLPTSQLLLLLQTRDESPWSEFDHGRPLSAFRLSKLLKPFGVRPRDIRFDQGVQKGYLRTDLEDPWERYLVSTSVESGQEGQQRQQASVYAAFEQFLKGQQQPSVADAKSGFSPGNTRLVADVAPSAPSWGELEAISVQIGTKANGTNYCWVHPTKKTHWWRRGGVDPVCG
ncbi:MAG TPA: DUF3631 domain-containing protein, partial [Terriglobales bacterium]|nr:DUF3631 domain-containing protein [Terriglobales bacterium]